MIFCPSWALNWNKSIVIVIVINIEIFISYLSELVTFQKEVAYSKIYCNQNTVLFLT